ncbi:MAG: tetratricopeptide repeat protein [Flavobacteriales bacterium]|nr:tetratricopeptide repeat protein [Flavobacteriales bacterium]
MRSAFTPARLIILFTGLVMPRMCIAQEVNADSLFGVSKNMSQHDTVRLAALNQFLWAGFMHQDPDSAYVLNEERLDLAKAKGYRQPEAEATVCAGSSTPRRASCQGHCGPYRLPSHHDSLGKKSGVGAALSGIGSIYYYQGDMVSAMKYFEQGLTAYEEAGHEPGIAICLNNIGNVHADTGEPAKALACYERVLKIRRSQKNVRGIASTLNNIGLIHADMAGGSNKSGNKALAATQRDQAITELNESIGYYRQVGRSPGRVWRACQHC